MDKINVETSQNVAIEYEIASVGDRILATLLDGLIMGGVTLILVTLTAAIDSPSFMFVIIGLPIMFYTLLCEIFMSGQTLGKRARNIKVIRVDGGQPSLGNYLLRWLLRLIEVVPYGIIAVITIIINGKGQRLGDIAAGTAVIKLRVKQKNKLQELAKPGEDYVPVFQEAADLSDRDVELIAKVLQGKDIEGQYHLVEKLTDKLKQTLNVESKLTPHDFLLTLLKDFNKINGRLG